MLAAGVFAVGLRARRPGGRPTAGAGAVRPARGGGRRWRAVLLAYPLWFQFLGPQHYPGMPFAAHGFQLDAASFTASARQTVLGDDRLPGLLSPNPTEENSFFGPGLLVLAVVIVIWLWRRPLVRALAVCGAGLRAALARRGGRGWTAAHRHPGAVPAGRRAAAARPRGAGPVRAGLRTGAGRAGGAVPGPGAAAARGTARRGGRRAGAAALGRRGGRRVAAAGADTDPGRAGRGRCRPSWPTGGWRALRAARPDRWCAVPPVTGAGRQPGDALVGPYRAGVPRPGRLLHRPQRPGRPGGPLGRAGPAHVGAAAPGGRDRAGAGAHRRATAARPSRTCGTGAPPWWCSASCTTATRSGGPSTTLLGPGRPVDGGWVWDVRALVG